MTICTLQQGREAFTPTQNTRKMHGGGAHSKVYVKLHAQKSTTENTAEAHFEFPVPTEPLNYNNKNRNLSLYYYW